MVEFIDLCNSDEEDDFVASLSAKKKSNNNNSNNNKNNSTLNLQSNACGHNQHDDDDPLLWSKSKRKRMRRKAKKKLSMTTAGDNGVLNIGDPIFPSSGRVDNGNNKKRQRNVEHDRNNDNSSTACEYNDDGNGTINSASISDKTKKKRMDSNSSSSNMVHLPKIQPLNEAVDVDGDISSPKKKRKKNKKKKSSASTTTTNSDNTPTNTGANNNSNGHSTQTSFVSSDEVERNRLRIEVLKGEFILTLNEMRLLAKRVLDLKEEFIDGDILAVDEDEFNLATRFDTIVKPLSSATNIKIMSREDHATWIVNLFPIIEAIILGQETLDLRHIKQKKSGGLSRLRLNPPKKSKSRLFYDDMMTLKSNIDVLINELETNAGMNSNWIGKSVSKVFYDDEKGRDRLFFGKVTAYDSDEGLYSITYEDGDEEDLNLVELDGIIEVREKSRKTKASTHATHTSSNKRVRRTFSAVGHVNNGACMELTGLSALLGFGLRIEKIVLGGPNEISNAISYFWGLDACLTIEMPLQSKNPNDLPIQKIIHDKVYELYYAEVGEDKSSGVAHNKPKKVTAYYVCSENLREEEEKLADYGALSPSKIWARRWHYISAAIKSKKMEYAVYHITANDVTMIDDVGTVGCGFISEEFLEDILGNNAEAKRALGIQVRIFVPTMGVFKGMLMRKANIVGIQVNLSLRKIGPSKHEEASNDGCIVIKRTFPSSDNFNIGRKFDITSPSKRLKPISELKGFKESLSKGKSCKISPMYERLLNGLGVSDRLLKQYSKDYKKDPDKLCHTHMIGMADPTNKLPSNTVFVTGMSGVKVDEIFVTRSPCMEAEDGRVIKVLRTKPDDMENTEWKFLQSLNFGALIFGDPRPGDRAMPELIAGGDLDGDLYFVCWDKVILSELCPIPITRDELVQTVEEVRVAQYNQDWFVNGQTYISKVPTHHLGIDRLVCHFYNKAIEMSDIRSPDAVSYSRAFKQALEVKKHGDRIFLPQYLWKEVPETLRHYLTADTGI